MADVNRTADYDTWLDEYMRVVVDIQPPVAMVVGALKGFWDHCLRHADTEYDGVHRFRQQITRWFGDKGRRTVLANEGYVSHLSLCMVRHYPEMQEPLQRHAEAKSKHDLAKLEKEMADRE
ncbi:MAG: hypothetical protein ACYTEQ_15675 [Planctomycetota bacterium]|jgi:hypothetical protein